MCTCKNNFWRLFPFILIISGKQSAAGKLPHQINFHEKKMIGSFTSNDLDNILKGHEEKNKDFESIFTTFPRLLVPFEQESGRQSDRTSPGILALRHASRINQNNRQVIEIWMSFSPQTNVSELDILFDNINHTQTVTTFLLQYQGQGPIKDVAEQIKQFSQYIKKTEAKNVISFGVILDLKHCQQNMDTIRKIPGNNVINTIFFHADKAAHSQIENGGNVEALESLKKEFQNCRGKTPQELNLTTFGLITKWPVFVNQGDGISLKIGDEKMLENFGNWSKSNQVSVVIEALFQNDSLNKHNIEKNAASHKDIDETWLNKPTLLSKKYIGVTLGEESMEYSKNDKFVHVIYDNFRKITVGDVTHTKVGDPKSLRKVVEVVAIFKRDVVRTGSGVGGVDIFEDQDPIQITISTQVSTYNRTVNERAIQNAFHIYKEGNDKYPDTVGAVVLNYEGYNMDSKLWENFIAPNIKYMQEKAKNAKSGGATSGIILPVKFCETPSTPDYSYPDLLIVFKETISMEDIETGLDEQVAQVRKKIEECQKKIQGKISNGKMQFRIQTSGCNSNKTMDELTKLVEFWEAMNTLAIEEKTIITMENAFDEPLNNGYCGWWKVVKNTKDELVIENKKTTALALYNKLYPGGKSKVFFWLVAVVLPIVGLVILLTGVAALLVIRYRSKYEVEKEQVDEFFDGRPDSEIGGETSPLIMGNNVGSDKAQNQPYDKERLEIPQSFFKIDTDSNLGSGEFGVVCRGTIKRDEKDVKVAVKMLKERQLASANDKKKSLDGLLSEIKILSHIGDHKNVIALVGAYTDELKMGKVYVFLELCVMGSLEKHLRSYERATERICSGTKHGDYKNFKILASNYQNISRGNGNYGEERYVNLEKKNILDDALAQDLMRWSREICSGIEHLVSKKVVHADLATRNVLLDLRKCAKIADFGLSRRLYNYTNYVKKKQEPLPWRWMSPESLRRREFNEKTDVWAFGITLWEIYSLGDQPYPGLSWDTTFSGQLDNGLRCGEPHFKEEGMYKLMNKCWDKDPASRPSFAELSRALSPSHYINITLPQLN